MDNQKTTQAIVRSGGKLRTTSNPQRVELFNENGTPWAPESGSGSGSVSGVIQYVADGGTINPNTTVAYCLGTTATMPAASSASRLLVKGAGALTLTAAGSDSFPSGTSISPAKGVTIEFVVLDLSEIGGSGFLWLIQFPVLPANNSDAGKSLHWTLEGPQWVSPPSGGGLDTFTVDAMVVAPITLDNADWAALDSGLKVMLVAQTVKEENGVYETNGTSTPDLVQLSSAVFPNVTLISIGAQLDALTAIGGGAGTVYSGLVSMVMSAGGSFDADKEFYPQTLLGVMGMNVSPLLGETPVNYTPTSPVLDGHLKGIDAALGSVSGAVNSFQTFVRVTDNAPLTDAFWAAAPINKTIVLFDQTDGTENALYITNETTTPTRHPDFPASGTIDDIQYAIWINYFAKATWAELGMMDLSQGSTRILVEGTDLTDGVSESSFTPVGSEYVLQSNYFQPASINVSSADTIPRHMFSVKADTTAGAFTITMADSNFNHVRVENIGTNLLTINNETASLITTVAAGNVVLLTCVGDNEWEFKAF